MALLIAGCDQSPQRHVVAIRGFRFTPDTVRIAPGDTIRWENQDFAPHTATSAAGFDSGSIEPGAGWQTAFDSARAFEYICDLHPSMRGVVIVE